jgi:hypothetical protein
MFAALLGYNPVQNLLAPYGVLSKLPAHSVAVLTGRQFFPHLIAAAFHHGLVIVFTAAAIMSVTGALVSLLRGKQFYYDDAHPLTAGPAVTVPPVAAPAPNTISPNGTASSSANGDSAPAVGPRSGDSPAEHAHLPRGSGG